MRDDFCGAGENEALLLSRGITNYGRSILPSIDTNRQQVHSRAFAETSDMHTENFFTLFLLLVRVRVLIFSASHTIPPDLSELKKHQVEVHKCFCKLLMGSSASEANFPARKSSFYNGLLHAFLKRTACCSRRWRLNGGTESAAAAKLLAGFAAGCGARCFGGCPNRRLS